MSARSLLSLATVVALASACGGDFDPASRIVSFRTVAMRATRVVPSDTCDAGLVAVADARPDRPPKLGKTNCDVSGSYAHPGDEVQLELLWHDPNPSAMRSWMWTTCLLPKSSSVFGCFQKLGEDFARLPPEQRVKLFDATRQRKGEAARAFETNDLVQPEPDGTKRDTRTLFRVQVPPDALVPLAGAPPQARAGATMGIVFLACPGNLVVNFEALSARNALPFKCLDPNTDEELGTDKFTIGIKRLFLREKDENQDPGILGVTWDGKAWPEDEVKEVVPSCDPGEARFDRCGDAEKHGVSVNLAPGFDQVGVDENGQEFHEQVVVQYYATEGLFEFDVKRAEVPGTKFAGRRTKTGDQTMWIVVRDSRGGVRWVERKFRVK
ncbi:MAG: hypothetical protein HYV09_25880 [Deltaproteobacteria bacterium]|nr:hypothetical protein [Deltaproteobacteria bacterium]